MKTRLSIKFKAIFLTIIFLMNTIVGFACTVGIDMGYNKSHHSEPQAVVKNTAHSHPPGTKKHSHQHAHTKTPTSKHHEKEHRDKKDDCCKDEVAKFLSIDKQTVKSTIIKVPLLLQEVIIPVYGQLAIVAHGVHTPNNSYFVRCHHPPIPDIRTAVKSFQI